jgi:hypothetical protein
MFVFFIHGVSTKNSSYADALIKNIKKEIAKRQPKNEIDFYSSYWGNLFNNKKHQIIACIEEDFSRACDKHQEYKQYHNDIYRYKRRREQLISNFLGDFLIYQNPERGKAIRRAILEQLNQFIRDHPGDNQIHFIAHSLGSIILWDLLFSDTLTRGDPAFIFREQLNPINLVSITTLGSPLLFFKQMLDIDFSTVDSFLEKSHKGNDIDMCKLRWVNVIHSSDLIAYPLKAAIENEISSKILFFDQYVWQDANGTEKTLRSLGQPNLAMVIAAEDAHSSYFYDNLDGAITGRIIAYNLLGKTNKLLERCVTPR